MVAAGTRDGLLSAMITVIGGQAHIAENKPASDWNAGMERCSHEFLKASVPQLRELKMDEIVKSDDKCGNCATGKSKIQLPKSSERETVSIKLAQ